MRKKELLQRIQDLECRANQHNAHIKSIYEYIGELQTQVIELKAKQKSN